jgi:anti-anti-sigma factor
MSNFEPAIKGNTATFTLSGRLDANNAPELADALKALIGQSLANIVFKMEELSYISSAGLRAIVFAKQKLGADTTVYVIKPKPEVEQVIKMTGFDSFLSIQDSFEG